MDSSLEMLNETIGVYVSKDHRFGTDAFLLADFAMARHKDTVCDLGTGCGIIPLILAKTSKPRQIFGIDIQKDAIRLFKKSIAYSCLDGSIIPVLGDLKDLDQKTVPHGMFDIVTCNPPYKIAGRGIISTAEAEKIARHETLCTIEDVCQTAYKLLKFGGKLCICQRPERLADTIAAMRQAKIEPKRLRFVAKNPASAPWLFLMEGKKGSKPFLQVEPILVIQGDNGFSEELMKIYGKM